MKKVRKKKKRRERKLDWEVHGDMAFTHDRPKHLRTEVIPDDDVMEDAPVIPQGVDPNAIVVSVSGPWAFVKTMDNEEVLCRIDDRLMIARSSVLAPGDEVLIGSAAEKSGEEEITFVRALGVRRTKLSRPAVKISRVKEQVFAANIDTLVIVASIRQPRFKPGLVDRYLVAADVGGVEPILCLNKCDLVDEDPKQIGPYRELELRVISTSCETGQGIDELKDALKGKLAVLAGQSGVGKSTIINCMDPSFDLDTQTVSKFNEKGRHTTSASRMYELEGDIRIIDTPGIRKLGLWGVSQEELAFYFPEMEELSANCQFRNCTHIHEPNCAVIEAVEEKKISKLRYRSYVRILESL